MENGRGFRGGGGRGWRGRPGGGPAQWRWMYKKRGWNGNRGGRGRGETAGNGGSRSAEEGSYDTVDSAPQPQYSRGSWGWKRGRGRDFGDDNDDNSPPATRKKRTDRVETMKSSIEKRWREFLPGYDLYYSGGPPQLPEVEKRVNAVVDYLLKRNPRIKDSLEDASGEEDGYLCFSLIVEDVVKDKEFFEAWPEFATDLVNESKQTIALWNAAAHKVIYGSTNDVHPPAEPGLQNQPSTNLKRVQMGFFKSTPVTPLFSINNIHAGKFVTIQGVIISCGSIHAFCRSLTFRCDFCEGTFVVKQLEGKFTSPTHCKVTEGCSNTYSFEPLESAHTTVIIDSRRITVRDVLYSDTEGGGAGTTMECLLFGTWVYQCNTGDVISLSGIVQMSVASARTQKRRNYIEVSALHQQKDSEKTMGGQLFSFGDKDFIAVKLMHQEPNLFRLLVNSLCPAIFGHEIVKAGLLLCLLGGTSGGDEGMFSRRSDINMLMVGDPGIGKSQMMKAVTGVAPKSVYLCGTGSTVAGLTVALVKDGDEYAVEAGALVMADEGICCIDEFDKMSSHHHALLEAMEQQSVSVAKCGVHTNLPARATVIAAANPVGGHYNKIKTVVENLKINPAILSRFDLIFILLDKPDKELDEGIAAHKSNLKYGASRNRDDIPGTVWESSVGIANPCSNKLIDRLKFRKGEIVDHFPHPLLRKYIAYARHYVEPKVSSEAGQILKNRYVELRRKRATSDSTPITVRQLESMVRLAQARAKAELREEVTVEDVYDVLDIFEFSLRSAYDEEIIAMSTLSESVLLNVSGMIGSKQKSIAGQAKQLYKVLQHYAIKLSKKMFALDEIKHHSATLGYVEKLDSLVAVLNDQGYLLHKGGKLYQLNTAN